MKTKPILRLAVLTITTTLLATTTRGITVDFVEGPEGQNVSINYSSADWWVVTPPVLVTGAESGSFGGTLAPGANLGNGSYAIGLAERPGGPLSDGLIVSWSSSPYSGVTNLTYLTTFTITFKSDIEGLVLSPPPGGFNTVALETGGLQEFRIPSTAFNLTAGIQSDIDAVVVPAGVPDGGSTVVLLGAASGVLVIVRRRLQ